VRREGAGPLENLPRRFQELLYPVHYESEVEQAARESGVDRCLVYAVIREESRFHGGARGLAGEVGPMQIMAGTGEWVARELGLPAEEADRSDPLVNVRMGTWLLRRNLDKFGGVPEYALAAYNGGGASMQRWRDRFKNRSREEVVELIGFESTRGYVRKVMFAYRTYRRLYAEGAGEETLTREPLPLASGDVRAESGGSGKR
jgi:soluble lytic murein transglycosylase